MKLVCLALLLVAASARPTPTDQSLINDIEHIAYLNSQNSTWEAGVNPRFENMSYADARALLGTSLSHISEHLESTLEESHYESLVADSDIPDSFSAVDQWKGLVKPIRD